MGWAEGRGGKDLEQAHESTLAFGFRAGIAQACWVRVHDLFHYPPTSEQIGRGMRWASWGRIRSS